ncbi:hypothetical protein KIN20_028623 [Parelaphostrongylus tenuis]|uniref:Uncharacterized protein n=1 Tax=Parelaphostrongylus tenuis TaxID=148309 RepID=A0AAD5R137_PARTN|nr:hypothetical protein KIN20_028623 [Parelaphostrongylus tenuis]
MIGRIDGLVTLLQDEEAELDPAKIRLLSHPDVIKENELKDKIELIAFEKKRLEEHMDQLRRNSETERMEQQETDIDRELANSQQRLQAVMVDKGTDELRREVRIEELEEALQESVSITAEREVHLSQQKHLLHQVKKQLNDARRENAELRKRHAECGSGEHEQQIRRSNGTTSTYRAADADEVLFFIVNPFCTR